jgi:branched-chain amino acid transport system substrate-binding protein
VIGKRIEAYWKSVNDAGGINGRKVNFITSTTATAAQDVEVVRQLVEQDKVLCSSTRSARRPTRRSTST